MKTKYKFIHFVNVGSDDQLFKGLVCWAVKNNRHGSLLGQIEWCPAWKQYCFFPEHNTIFNNSCLSDIQHLIGQLK